MLHRIAIEAFVTAQENTKALHTQVVPRRVALVAFVAAQENAETSHTQVVPRRPALITNFPSLTKVRRPELPERDQYLSIESCKRRSRQVLVHH